MSWPNVISQIGGFLALLFLRPATYDLLCVMLMAATADVLVVCTCVCVLSAYIRTYVRTSMMNVCTYVLCVNVHTYVHTYRVVCIQSYNCLVFLIDLMYSTCLY